MANYRKTKLYQTLTTYDACAIAEGFDGQEYSRAEVLTAWQWLVDTGKCWRLQGWYGRTATALIEGGYIKKAKKDRTDAYGQVVKGTD